MSSGLSSRVPLPVGEEVLDDLQRRHIGAVKLADKVYGAGHVGDEVQLLGAHIDVAGKDVVGDYVLDEGGLVVLFLVVRARLVHRDGGEDAHAAGNCVVPGHEHRVVETRARHAEQLICSDG